MMKALDLVQHRNEGFRSLLDFSLQQKLHCRRTNIRRIVGNVAASQKNNDEFYCVAVADNQ